MREDPRRSLSCHFMAMAAKSYTYYFAINNQASTDVTITLQIPSSVTFELSAEWKVDNPLVLEYKWSLRGADDPIAGVIGLKFCLQLPTDDHPEMVSEEHDLLTGEARGKGQRLISGSTRRFMVPNKAEKQLAGKLQVHVSEWNGKQFGVQSDLSSLVSSLAGQPVWSYSTSLSSPVESSVASRCRHPNDVCLCFENGQELWASSAMLKAKSPYFYDLLESEFAEAQMVVKRELLGGKGVTVDLTDEWQDSDAEDEQPRPKLLELSSCLAPFFRIEVHEFAFRTYQATLVWLATGHVLFAPLTSTYFDGTEITIEEARAARETHIQNCIDLNPLLPPPVSCKSVYRLAEFLSLPALASYALADFSSQLSPSNVARELFSPVPLRHAALRAVAIDVCAERWAEVQENGDIEKWSSQADPAAAFSIILKLMQSVTGTGNG